jgi:hypothetical protein
MGLHTVCIFGCESSIICSKILLLQASFSKEDVDLKELSYIEQRKENNACLDNVFFGVIVIPPAAPRDLATRCPQKKVIVLKLNAAPRRFFKKKYKTFFVKTRSKPRVSQIYVTTRPEN